MPVNLDLPAAGFGDGDDGEGSAGEGDEAGDGEAGFFLLEEEGVDGGLDIGGEGVFGVGEALEMEVLIVTEDVSSFNVEDVGSFVLFFLVEIADFEVGSVV